VSKKLVLEIPAGPRYAGAGMSPTSGNVRRVATVSPLLVVVLRVVQVPSSALGDVTTSFAEAPVDINTRPFHAIDEKVDAVYTVQSLDEVGVELLLYATQPIPVATHRVPDQHMLKKFRAGVNVNVDHVIPSDELANPNVLMPSSTPDARNTRPFHAIDVH
jgi:hypothetical protein